MGQALTMTASRYSLGTTIVPSSARLNRAISSRRSASSAVATGVADGLERLQRRAVVAAPVVDVRLRRAVAERVVALLDADLGDRLAEQLVEPLLGAPLDRRAQAGRRRHVRADRLEQLADEAVRRVGDEPDPAARPGDPDELVRGPLLVRREHRPEDRAHDVEAAVVERQRLGVALDELGVEALGLGAPTGPVEQGRDVVDADDLAAAPRGCEGGVAAARSRRRARARSSGRRGPRSAAPTRSGSASRSCGSRRSTRSPAGAA